MQYRDSDEIYTLYDTMALTDVACVLGFLAFVLTFVCALCAMPDPALTSFGNAMTVGVLFTGATCVVQKVLHVLGVFGDR